MSRIKLEQLGFDAWFRNKNEELIKDGFHPARVAEVNKNSYLIIDEKPARYAELAGKFLYGIDSSLNLPTVGDWVFVQSFEGDSPSIIHEILPRKSTLKRKDPGKNIEFQLIAANIDFACIIQSADENFNLNRLERYLTMAQDGNIQPIILLSKCDLISKTELLQFRNSIDRLNSKYTFIPFSNKTTFGLSEVAKQLIPAKTYCLLGSSGVGKTTLLNRLLGEEKFAVNTVREKDHRGRHTTARRQLIYLDSGSMLIDTPGMRELGNFDIKKGMQETFEDIYSLTGECQFRDCTHIHEKGCAVLEAVKSGSIDGDRYANFLKIIREAAFLERSYSEKRRMDKKFGKMVKRIMKHNRKK